MASNTFSAHPKCKLKQIDKKNSIQFWTFNFILNPRMNGNLILK